jgi:hypothetical protein
MAAAEACEAALGGALGAIAALLTWLTFRVVRESSLVEESSALMRVEGIKGLMLKILLRVCARRDAVLHSSFVEEGR